jgi:DNA integrity scanning protein DisA with diadenylate cyclase activity/mannitol/fructose-specific phosphotransferase system IIA component (Ntr-type)
VELAELVGSIQVIELTAKTRAAAIRALIHAAHWEDERISEEKALVAIEAREATAHTLVAEGLALPHASVDWDGDFLIVLGRSRPGIEYGAPANAIVHLMVLLIVGKGREVKHLELLAAVAELLNKEEFRQDLIEAPNTNTIERLLLKRAGVQQDTPFRRRPGIPRLSALLVRQAIQVVDAVAAQALLLAVERVEAIPWDALSRWTGRLLVVVNEQTEAPLARPDTHVFNVPQTTLSRMDRANLGLLLAAAEGILHERATVVCVTGIDGRRLDTITVTKLDPHLSAMFDDRGKKGGVVARSAVILRALSLAIELAAEGREGKPTGGLFVVGDSQTVLRHAHQLVLNPFHGYSKQLRNILDPSLAETIKEFALIDGAFIVQGDGTVLSAGTYLVPRSIPGGLPAGLGTRHQTAAGITANTRSTAITVSQSTGAVTMFRDGAIIFTLERAIPTRW